MMINDFRDMQSMLGKVIQITCDGTIDKSEEKDWLEVQKIGNNLLKSLNSLLNSKGNGEGEIHVD